jgi:hypothetical protein
VTKLDKFECRSARVSYGCPNIATIEAVAKAGSSHADLKFWPSAIEYYCKPCFDELVKNGRVFPYHREIDTSNFVQCKTCANFDDKYSEDNEMSYSNGKCAKSGKAIINGIETDPILCDMHAPKEATKR